MERAFRRLFEKLLPRLLRIGFSGRDPILEFTTWDTIRLNQRRLEHLESLRLALGGRTVLEVGAGIGNLTDFFLDRGCSVVTTEARPENLAVLKARHPQANARQLDLDQPSTEFASPFDIVFCYGLLYHLRRPAEALAHLARWCQGLVLLETCVSFGDDEQIHPCSEDALHVSQAISGVGCRPTRPWVLRELKRHFGHVYVPETQPCHDQFPLDWTSPASHRAPFSRAVFIASRAALDHPGLLEGLPPRQRRH
jgi:SAM-dependent methyltransferase